MTLTEQKQFISDTFENGLPALLTTANLQNFDEYLPSRELRSTDLELCVYVDYSNNTIDKLETSFIIKAQLYHKDLASEYFDVIYPFILENLKAESLDYTNLVSLTSDFMPADMQSTSYVFFNIIYSKDLDDCEEY